MPNDEVKDSAFMPDEDLYGKKPKIEPAPETQIGVDTDNKFYEDISKAGISNQLDMSAFDSFLTTARSRDQIYNLIDSMSEDSIIASVLETYAEDATETNEDGDIVWVDSADPDIAKMISYLLKAMRVNKNIYGWVFALIKYGDVYLRMYRESDYEKDPLFDDDEKIRNKAQKLNEDIHLNDPDLDPDLGAEEKEKLTEAVKIKAYSEDDHYVPYLEMNSNPAEMFELTKFGKSYAYIKADINASSTFSSKKYFESGDFLRYQFKKNDINVYQATEFVHAYLEDDANRTPEEVKIFFTDSDDEDGEKALSATYKVRRGQSLLYDIFKVWRELTLLENSILLNRVTKSSLVRVIGVEVGDMPKEMVQPHLQGIKSLIEQKSSLDAGNSMNEYTNPGPVENNVYIPTRNGQGAITMSQVGGDVQVGQLTDLDYFRDRLFGGLGVPKQYFGFTEDGAGFNGGQSLSIISSRYAKRVVRIQNTILQALTDAINLMLIDRGLKGYVNKYKLHMLPPITQGDLDRRENLSAKVQLTRDTMDMLADIEAPAVKLEILKNLMSSYITDPDILHLIQGEIDKLNNEEEEAPEEETGSGEEDLFGLGEEPEEEFGGEGGGQFATDFIDNLGETPTEETPEEAPIEEPAGEEALPTPASLGLDFTDSNNPEFQ